MWWWVNLLNWRDYELNVTRYYWYIKGEIINGKEIEKRNLIHRLIHNSGWQFINYLSSFVVIIFEKIVYRFFSQWYYTPLRIRKTYGIEPQCWRRGISDAGFRHVWWACKKKKAGILAKDLDENMWNNKTRNRVYIAQCFLLSMFKLKRENIGLYVANHCKTFDCFILEDIIFYQQLINV